VIAKVESAVTSQSRCNVNGGPSIKLKRAAMQKITVNKNRNRRRDNATKILLQSIYNSK